jgi:hypothetical protein
MLDKSIIQALIEKGKERKERKKEKKTCLFLLRAIALRQKKNSYKNIYSYK